MNLCGIGGLRCGSLVIVGTLVVGLGLAGCQRFHEKMEAKSEDSTPSTPTAAIPAQGPDVSLDPHLHQPFSDATRSEPPADWQRPPDQTLSGLSVGKLYTEVVASWDSIRFQNHRGQPISYKAILDTELGEIEISLRPDLAPNHVRNFIALARAGYYDGLVFERTIHERSSENPEVEIQRIEGGCPLGKGELGQGSIGYWLKPEFSAESHEVGAVGACRGQDVDTAACRFYITLNKSPSLDRNFTVFGYVTGGMDVAGRIFSLPVRNDPEYPEGDRPEKPVVIRKVILRSSEDIPSTGAGL
jgi:peptidyl-prolyl cis-trans isomerase B (cyclophilin B)